MKVLMFGWEFPPHISGGLGTACYGLTKGLNSLHNLEIIFVVPKAYGDEDQSAVRVVGAGDVSVKRKRFNYSEVWKDITYIEVGSLLIPYTTPEEYQNQLTDHYAISSDYVETDELGRISFSGKYGPNLMQEVSNYAIIASVIAQQYDFDVIHAHDWMTYAAGIAAKKASGKPLVIHVHATEFDRSGENVNQQVFDIERAGMINADKIITVSNLTKSIVIERYGINPDKVVTVYNAVEPNQSALEPKKYERTLDEKIVTFLGRITFQKGPEYFVEAAHMVLQRKSNVRFVMAGSGDLFNRMVKRAAELGIGSKFHFTGFLKGEEVDKMFALSDVYVMPSVSEPFGISPLEAMRSNVPVIISKQSGVAEILQHAIKVDFWDVNAIADAIYGLITYDALSSMFRQYGKDEVDKLKWENAAYHVKEVYDSVVRKH